MSIRLFTASNSFGANKQSWLLAMRFMNSYTRETDYRLFGHIELMHWETLTSYHFIYPMESMSTSLIKQATFIWIYIIRQFVTISRWCLSLFQNSRTMSVLFWAMPAYLKFPDLPLAWHKFAGHCRRFYGGHIDHPTVDRTPRNDRQPRQSVSIGVESTSRYGD